MNYRDIYGLKKGLKILSTEAGILCYMSRLPMMHSDPLLLGYGICPSDTTCLGGLFFSGRSSGCGYSWDEAALGTIGEVIERYCPAFYDKHELIKSSYSRLQKKAIHPNEIALFHPEQYKELNFPFVPFTEKHEVHWTKCYDLLNSGEVLFPASLIYMPWAEEEELIALSTSTGLAGHSNLYEAILIGLYEVLERDSFVLTWMQELVTPKIVITPEISSFLRKYYPENYRFHFFDITYDIRVPVVMGICFGESDYGEFVAVGSASRATFGQALQKVIKEIGQAVSYFRYLLNERKDWYPTRFSDVHSFEDHSIFYLKRKDLWYVFDKWINAEEKLEIQFNEKPTLNTKDEIRAICSLLKEKGYDVLIKYLTTPDIEQINFHSVKVLVPQLIQLGGSYNYYFSGGQRLYTVPEIMGYTARNYSELNKYPHPFP